MYVYISICNLIFFANLRMTADFHAQTYGVCMAVISEVVGCRGSSHFGSPAAVMGKEIEALYLGN